MNMEDNLFLLRRWAYKNSYKEWWLMTKEEIIAYQKVYEIDHDIDIVVIDEFSDDGGMVESNDTGDSISLPPVVTPTLPTKSQIVLDCVQSGNSKHSEVMNAIHKYYPDCTLKETTIQQYIQKAIRILNSKK